MIPAESTQERAIAMYEMITSGPKEVERLGNKRPVRMGSASDR